MSSSLGDRAGLGKQSQGARRRQCRLSASLCLFAVSAAAQPASLPPLPPLQPPILSPAGAAREDAVAKSLAPLDKASTKAKDEQIIAHLSSVVRYYHLCANPVQRVGEPSDSIYEEKLAAGAKEIASYAFQFGTAAAILLSASDEQSAKGSGNKSSDDQMLEGVLATAVQQIQSSKAKKLLLASQLKGAEGHYRQSLQLQADVLDGVIQLNVAMSDALNKVLTMSDAKGRSDMIVDVEHLQRTLPELSDHSPKASKPPATSLSSTRSAGIVSQITALFSLASAEHSINKLLADTEELHRQALDLRSPLEDQVRATYSLGQQLSQPQGADKADLADQDPGAIQKQLLTIRKVTDRFEKLSTAAVPLYQEIIVLEQSRANLQAWYGTAENEYKGIMTSLLLRVAVICGILALLFLAGEIWRRATMRFVHDQRRRRQLLAMRRMVVGFLSLLVVLFGCVTQFNSLATFAGFITAGLAVGLQTILLSVAAYFFIVGKYGIRVGDRITVSGVTGDVLDVGLVRFYLMELPGVGTDLPPTGRVAVFSNAVLFQAGTPLYKQMPGTDYAWHEMSVALQSADYGKAAAIIHKAVEEIFAGYRERIQQQHQLWESSMEMPLRIPAVESTIQLVEQQLRLLVRFPVQLHDAEAVDQKIAEMMMRVMEQEEVVKECVVALPTIKATTSTR